MSWRIGRQLPFLSSILKAADHQTRRERLQAANADQINALSELVMNTLRGQILVSSSNPDQVTASSTSTKRHDPS